MKKNHVGEVRRPQGRIADVGDTGYSANELCFRCYYATGGCEWSDHFQPVPGWKVEKGKFEGWLHIIECPKYEKGDRIWSKAKKRAIQAAKARKKILDSLNVKESSSTSESSDL